MQTDSAHRTSGKDKTKEVYLPRTCQLCETSFNPVSARALRCHNCNLNSSQPDDMEMEIASIETTTSPPSSQDYLSIIHNLENTIKQLQEENSNLRSVNTELKVRLADNILAVPVQKSCAQALSEVQPGLPKCSSNPIILEPSITTGIKLTNAEVNTVREKKWKLRSKATKLR